MAQKKEPDKTFRLGRIKAAIWANRTEDGKVWFNVEPTRRYKEGDKWHDATTFGHDDLPIVALAINMAYEWIWRQKMPADPNPVEE
ncbi:MAG: hypothetical protein HY290_04285 [Planctomycetia bacterium]|nr:hypothetical protein [Planctomycetia bacterium]